MNRNFENMGNYILLARTIIWLSCKDYMRVVRGLKRDPESGRLKAEYRQIMDFFKSDDFIAYSLGADYEYYIRKMDEMIEAGKQLPSNSCIAR